MDYRWKFNENLHIASRVIRIVENSGVVILNLLGSIQEQVWHQIKTVIYYPARSGQRIYFLYLLSALIFALLIFARSSKHQSGPLSGVPRKFLQFLFPQSVWTNPSAWLDVRYFFFHQVLFVSWFGWLGLTITDWAGGQVSTLLHAQEAGMPQWLGERQFLAGIIYMVVLVVLIDFTAFLIHRLQHKVPLLWAFHKVHHSATVMHPLTNYREHPIDNLFYLVGIGLVTGAAAGMSVALIGGVLRTPTIMGVSLLVFLFNFLAYNLRHSHIWIRWPGRLNYVFGCPAHHQVHHSCHPDHIDRNFAFMFPVWDLVFGSYCLPRTNRDVVYGLGNGEEKDFRSCLGLYLVPFRKLLEKRKRRVMDPK